MRLKRPTILLVLPILAVLVWPGASAQQATGWRVEFTSGSTLDVQS